MIYTRLAQKPLPMSPEELPEGISAPDFVYVTGDAYVDHPSFGGINFIDAYENDPPIVTDLRNTSGMTAVVDGHAYGAQSLLPDEEGRLNLLLPLNASYPGEEGPWCEALENTLLRQWATCVPTMNVSKSGQSVGVGGDIEVIENIDGMNVNTNNLLYLDADDMMKEVEIVDGEMHIQCGANRANITNEESFRIKKHLNIIKAIEQQIIPALECGFHGISL